MNLDNLKMVLEVVKLMDGEGDAMGGEAFTPHIGKPSIIRTYASGVFFGVVTKQEERMVEIKDCRRLWSWKASESISLSAVAMNGVSTGKFSPVVPSQTVLDALEIIPASDKAVRSINAIKDAVQS